MNTMAITLRNRLGYAGLIPFLGFALAMLLLPQQPAKWPLLGFASYSALISSFMAGTLWGQVAHSTGSPSNTLFLSSNFLCLSAWFGALLCLSWPVAGVTLIGSSFLGIIGLERHYIWQPLKTQLTEPKPLESYISLRWRLTLLVLLTHLIALIALVNPYGG